MVSNIFRPPYITLTFSHNNMVTTIATMADNNTLSFNMCNFEIISDFKKKTQNFF